MFRPLSTQLQRENVKGLSAAANLHGTKSKVTGRTQPRVAFKARQCCCLFKRRSVCLNIETLFCANVISAE